MTSRRCFWTSRPTWKDDPSSFVNERKVILMRMLRRLAAIWMIMMLMMGSAFAEVPFLQHAAEWTLENTPLEVRLSAGVTSHMPYDDERLAMLTELLSHLSLRIMTDGEGGGVSVYVGNTEAVTIAYQGDAAQLSTIPRKAFTSSGDAVGSLLGANLGDSLSVFGLRGNAESLLDDGWVLLNSIDPLLEAYADRRSVKTSIENMGTARSCTDYTIPKADAEKFGELLLSVCPDGWLREIITSMTFSGKLTLRIYRTEDELPLRAEFNGVCGPEDDLRTVKLVWRARRDNTAHRDEITLTSPAKKGSNKNTLEFERVIKTNKKGAVEMDGSFTWTVTADKKTTTTKGSFDLTNAAAKDKDVLTGEVTLQQKLPGESKFTYLVIEPDVTITGTEEEPVVTGSVSVTEKVGSGVTEQAVINVSLARADGSLWEEGASVIDLDAMSEKELHLLQQQVADSITSAVVRPLILLLEDSADWFFRDIPADAVQQIIDAAGSSTVYQ